MDSEMKFRYIQQDIAIGERIPRYLGYGKRRFDMAATFYYIIPVNFIVRFWERVVFYWFKILHEDKLRKRDNNIYADGYEKGYCDGYNRGRELMGKYEKLILQYMDYIVKIKGSQWDGSRN